MPKGGARISRKRTFSNPNPNHARCRSLPRVQLGGAEMGRTFLFPGAAEDPRCNLTHSCAPSIVTGVVLSVVADLVISVSLSVTKLAHNRNQDPVTGAQRKPYVKIPLWWLGIALNASGELGNLFAYGFAPASVVTPVGSVGVLGNAILARCFLKEPLRNRDLIGMSLIIGGVVMIVVGVPEVPEQLTPNILMYEVLPHPRCWLYLLCLFGAVGALLTLAKRGWGDRHILVYLGLCSLISSVTVIAARRVTLPAVFSFPPPPPPPPRRRRPRRRRRRFVFVPPTRFCFVPPPVHFRFPPPPPPSSPMCHAPLFGDTTL